MRVEEEAIQQDVSDKIDWCFPSVAFLTILSSVLSILTEIRKSHLFNFPWTPPSVWCRFPVDSLVSRKKQFMHEKQFFITAYAGKWSGKMANVCETLDKNQFPFIHTNRFATKMNENYEGNLFRAKNEIKSHREITVALNWHVDNRSARCGEWNCSHQASIKLMVNFTQSSFVALYAFMKRTKSCYARGEFFFFVPSIQKKMRKKNLNRQPEWRKYSEMNSFFTYLMTSKKRTAKVEETEWARGGERVKREREINKIRGSFLYETTQRSATWVVGEGKEKSWLCLTAKTLFFEKKTFSSFYDEKKNERKVLQHKTTRSFAEHLKALSPLAPHARIE